MSEVPDFTPVNLLTGFLGSGKTTLLRELLMDPALADTAVLINEFGEIGLDHQLVGRIDDNMVLLQSGCLCCTVRGELADAIRDLHSRREKGLVPPFSRVVIESTGLADPFPVLSTIKADPVLRHHFRPGNVITTVDAVRGLETLERYNESIRQAAIADRLVITKTDIASGDAVSGLLNRLREINPDALIVDRANGGIDPSGLLGDPVENCGPEPDKHTGFFCDEPVPTSFGGGGHKSGITSFTISVTEEVDWTAFGIWLTMLINRHGNRILRVKGILHLAGEDRPVAIHSVQHLVHPPVHLGPWPTEDRRSDMVFIVDGLDPQLIKRSFRAFAFAARDTRVDRGIASVARTGLQAYA